MSNKVSKTVEGNLNRAGRPKGVPNKTTASARQAFATLVEGNAPKMQTWLEKVADGIPVMETIKEGDKTFKRQAERNGIALWLVPPSPDKALDIMQKMAEYHIPKLARTEHVGENQGPIKYEIEWSK